MVAEEPPSRFAWCDKKTDKKSNQNVHMFKIENFKNARGERYSRVEKRC